MEFKNTLILSVLTPCSLVGEFNVSAEHITFFPEDGGDTFHRNMGTYLPDETLVQKPRIRISPPMKTQIDIHRFHQKQLFVVKSETYMKYV